MKDIKSLFDDFKHDFDDTYWRVAKYTMPGTDYYNGPFVVLASPLIAVKSAAKSTVKTLFDKKYIKIVQNTILTENVTVEHFITYIADVDGGIEWSVFKPEAVNFKVVEALVKKNNRVALIQFKVNPSTKLVKIGYVGIDGKPASLSDLVSF
jgi:hypothetical protein